MLLQAKNGSSLKGRQDMASAFMCGKSYIYVSNMRTSALVEGAIEVAQDIAVTETEKDSVARLKRWWKEEAWNGIDIDVAERFHTTEEFKLWAQAFESRGWRVFYRKWGNQANETWQVGFIANCHVISRMLTELVWQEDRTWFPAQGDVDGIRPDPIRIRQ
jgi:hypothetical protein